MSYCVQHSAGQGRAVQCSAVHYSTVQGSAVHYSAVVCTEIRTQSIAPVNSGRRWELQKRGCIGRLPVEPHVQGKGGGGGLEVSEFGGLVPPGGGGHSAHERVSQWVYLMVSVGPFPLHMMVPTYTVQLHSGYILLQRKAPMTGASGSDLIALQPSGLQGKGLHQHLHPTAGLEKGLQPKSS